MKYNKGIMEEKFKEQSTFWLTLELLLRMKPRMVEVAESHKLTPQQMHVLGFLSYSEPHPMSWLAALLFCDASNVTGIIDRLVTLGFVRRVECQTDRRVKMVQLTSSGAKVRADMMYEISLESQGHLEAMLTKEEQAQFRQIIIKLLVGTDQEALRGCPVQGK